MIQPESCQGLSTRSRSYNSHYLAGVLSAVGVIVTMNHLQHWTYNPIHATSGMGIHVAWQSYKAAIFLSNTGVSMMQCQCFPEATATLRDALELMREAAGPSTRDPLLHETRVHCLLREASVRLASVSSKGTYTAKQDQSSPATTVSLLVLGDDLTSDFVQTALKAPSTLSNDAVAIRIDDKEADDSVTRFHLDSASILFNYATAARCLGVTTTSPCYDLSVIARATHKSYHKAYGILSKIQTYKDDSASYSDDLQVIRIHLLAMLTVQNLASSALELHMPEKAEEYYHLLGGLNTMYRYMERIPSLLNASRRVAPAA